MKSFVLGLLVLIFSVSPETEVAVAEEVCLSKEELKLYKLIMDYRKKNNLEAIPISSKLTKVAKVHARDLVDHYSFDPTNKCNPHSWSKKGKWSGCCYTSDHKEAECMWNKPKEIAGYNGSGYEIAYYSSAGANAEEGLEGWKASPGHNPLLINTGIWDKLKWNAIGIGIYKEYGLVWFGEAADSTIIKTCD
ncbi:MAG TPA: CAP domain-containing protein [Ohtaekwangia sp.]|nr:CAP domain-containing protein [Ohtaekwangia sp.]